ncbi:MAG: hypothetical protein ABR511_00950 [Acidimicrobiales bacterium]
MTSRWVVAAAEERGLLVRWKSFSLAKLNEGKPLPAFLDTPEFRAKMDLAAAALRVLQAAISHGDNDAAGRLYAEWGVRFHEAGREPTPDLLEEVAAAAGARELLAKADDPALDAAITASLEEALRLAGPEVGSPVIHLDGAQRGTFGPIVSPPPVGEEAGRLWDAVVALSGIDSFFELKRGRTGPPVFGPSR